MTNIDRESPEYQEYLKQKIAQIAEELKAYGEQYRLRGLEGRIQRGLDPAGMLAVKETREKLERIAKGLGADMKDVISLTNELHVGGIWKNADALAEGKRPDVKTWMVAGEVTVSGKEKEQDLTPEEFIADYERVNKLLEEGGSNPEDFAVRARENLITRSREQYKVEDGVPVSELDSGFLAMAVNGHKAGIVKDKGGLLFVGANELDYGSLEKVGLKALEKEDRGRMATFYQDQEGKDVVKKLYPGFSIVLNGDIGVGKKLAMSGAELASKRE